MKSSQYEAKIRELRERLQATKAQRDKIRLTRDKLRFKLLELERRNEVIEADHLARWHTAMVNSEAVSMEAPGTEIVEHVSYRKDAEFDVGVPFLRNGYVAMLQIRRLLDPLGNLDLKRVLDFGCGCGRVTRFLGELGEGVKVFGCDIDAEAIHWAKKHVDPDGYFVSADMPPLEIPGGKGMDLIVAMSVFTHLPEEMQDSWLAELGKRLNPGGILVATFHGPSFHRFVPDPLRGEFEAQGIVYTDLGKTPGLPDYYLSTFHTHDYIRERWGQFFEVLTIEELGLSGQDVAVLRIK